MEREKQEGEGTPPAQSVPHRRVSAVSLTIGTNAVEIQPVKCGFETVLAGQRVLQFFYLRVDDFDVAPAVFANKMIVVGVGGVLIAGQPIAKPYLTASPASHRSFMVR